MPPLKVKYSRPWLYPKQIQAFFNDRRYSVIEGSTKSGKTVSCIVWIYETAVLGAPDRNYWWVAPVYSQAKIAYRRLKKYLPEGTFKANESELKITLINGAHIFFKSGENPDNLYGEDVYGCVIDEASRIREDSWFAVRSTLTATRGPIRIIGNVKGRRNWFFILARKAQSGDKDMFYSKITAYDAVDAGILDPAEVEDAKAVLPEKVFRELYLAEPADDEGNPFNIKAIHACIVPVSTKPPVVYGIDLAKSYDWTVITGLDEHGHESVLERFQKGWDDTVSTIKRVVGKNTRAVIDATGVGDPIAERLQNEGFTNIESFKFTASSKQQLMESLAVSIQSGHVGFNSPILVSELESFEYVYTRTGVKYSAPEGMHDDTVCSLALANYRMHFTTEIQPRIRSI